MLLVFLPLAYPQHGSHNYLAKTCDNSCRSSAKTLQYLPHITQSQKFSNVLQWPTWPCSPWPGFISYFSPPHPSHSSPLTLPLLDHHRHTPALGLGAGSLLYFKHPSPRYLMAYSFPFFKSLFKIHFLGPSKISTPPWNFLSPFLHYLFSWVLTIFQHTTYFAYISFIVHLSQFNVGSMKAGIFIYFVPLESSVHRECWAHVNVWSVVFSWMDKCGYSPSLFISC